MCTGEEECTAIVDTSLSVITGPVDYINSILKTLGVSLTHGNVVRTDVFCVTTALSLLVLFVYSPLLIVIKAVLYQTLVSVSMGSYLSSLQTSILSALSVLYKLLSTVTYTVIFYSTVSFYHKLYGRFRWLSQCRLPLDTGRCVSQSLLH